ncbi:MAG: hypothetical protein V1920_04960 [Bacillota bacterium]
MMSWQDHKEKIDQLQRELDRLEASLDLMIEEKENLLRELHEAGFLTVEELEQAIQKTEVKAVLLLNGLRTNSAPDR